MEKVLSAFWTHFKAEILKSMNACWLPIQSILVVYGHFPSATEAAKLEFPKYLSVGLKKSVWAC
jgi:hypothetical protein